MTVLFDNLKSKKDDRSAIQTNFLRMIFHSLLAVFLYLVFIWFNSKNMYLCRQTEYDMVAVFTVAEFSIRSDISQLLLSD